MADYTLNPTPIFKAQKIDTPEDAAAWLASLTDNELIDGELVFANVRIDFVDDQMWLRYERVHPVSETETVNLDTNLGGYAIANVNYGGINLSVESVESFTRRFQPYPVQ